MEAVDKRIVVVDDDRIILELTSVILRSKGYQVFTAGNGVDARVLIERERPEVVLLDYMMPAMDGMLTLKKIREFYPDTYVMMFTGEGNEEIAVELMKAGASDYILKPFNNQNLIDRLENVLRIRSIEIHNRELRQEREQLLREIEQWNLELERRVEEKTRELEKAHAEIVQGEKLAALGHLSAGMAHEIRNPLNTISLFNQLIKNGLDSDNELLGYVDKSLKEVDRIDGILIKLLAASKRPQYELHMVSVADIIDQTIEKFADQIKAHGISLEKEFKTEPPPILADVTEMEQIFNNIIANALYEMQQGGILRLRLSHDAEAIYVSVSDTGGGIAKENLSQIFDPFFTTKDRGTGFGLSVVLRIVKTYGGRISVESTPGQGTIFHIQLPLE
jgi:signal transduction histidine kinase